MAPFLDIPRRFYSKLLHPAPPLPSEISSRSLGKNLLIAEGLKCNLTAVLDGSESQSQLDALVRTTHAIAAQMLRYRKSADFAGLLQGLCKEDLAYDFIAELFRRDASNRYVSLQAFFGCFDLSAADDAEVLVYLKRLTGSAVSQGLFRAFSEADPALGRILRNIKLAVHSLKTFGEIEVFGEPCLVPALCESLDHLQMFDRQTILREISMVASGNERIPGLLAHLATILRGQEDNARVIPMLTAALAFRDLYEKKNVYSIEKVSEQQHQFTGLLQVVERSCRRVKDRVSGKYTRKKGIAADVLERYFAAIMTHFQQGADEDSAGLYDSLLSVWPELEYEEYRHVHRPKVEYLARLVQQDLAKSIGKSDGR